MNYTEDDIQKIADHAHDLLNKLNTTTALYISTLKNPHTPLIVQGAVGIFMKNVLEATLYAMESTKKERQEFMHKFRNVMMQTIDSVDLDELLERKKKNGD